MLQHRLVTHSPRLLTSGFLQGETTTKRSQGGHLIVFRAKQYGFYEYFKKTYSGTFAGLLNPIDGLIDTVMQTSPAPRTPSSTKMPSTSSDLPLPKS